jgi:hypothetical protein
MNTKSEGNWLKFSGHKFDTITKKRKPQQSIQKGTERLYSRESQYSLSLGEDALFQFLANFFVFFNASTITLWRLKRSLLRRSAS